MVVRESIRPYWRKDRDRQKAKEAGKEAGKEGGKLQPSKLTSIFRKMFICRSVKLTRGVYLPALPSHPLCYHLLRSLSRSQCSGSMGRGHFAPTEQFCRFTEKYQMNTPVINAAVVLLYAMKQIRCEVID